MIWGLILFVYTFVSCHVFPDFPRSPQGQHLKLNDRDMQALVRDTQGYSASDLAALCKEAAMAPLRELPPERLASVPASALRPLERSDFEAAMKVVRPSVSTASLRAYEDFTKTYGTQ